MTTKKLRFKRVAEAAPPDTGGEGQTRTRVIAYLQGRPPLLSKENLYHIDVICVSNLERLAGFAEAKASQVGVIGSGGTSRPLGDYLILIDHDLRDADKARLSGFVMNDAPVVLGPNAADDFTWHLKAEANSRGRIFEVAESSSALERVFATSLESLRLRNSVVAARMHVGVYPARPVDPDPLATLPGILETTHSLRSERGRLDAEKVRDLFTLSRAELARITGIQEETIRQTPDSERLQRPLQAFDRVARLLALNSDRAKFAAWLNAANDELDSRTPLDLIRDGRMDVLETLVHDILTNRGR